LLAMHRDDDESPQVPFNVAVRDDAANAVGSPALTAFLTWGHRACGSVHRVVRVGADAPAAAPGAVTPEPLPEAELALDPRAKPADLTIDVVRTPDNDD